MTQKTMIYAGLAVVAFLYFKAQKTSTSTGQQGEGGPPAWTNTTGPMGPKFNPMTGTMEMQPLNVMY